MSPISPLSRLIESLPDLAVEVSREGAICAHAGGNGVPELKPKADASGQTLESIWPAPVAALVKQTTRKAIASRTPMEVRFSDRGHAYQARISARGPDRALCIVRLEPPRGSVDDPAASAHPLQKPHLDRRGFMHKFYATVSQCLMAEKPVAAIVVQLDGVAAICRAVDPRVSDEVVTSAILRLPSNPYSLGQLNKSTLALLMETADRATIEAFLSQVCESLRGPIALGDSTFHVSPHAGVAILGQDATSAKDLLHHARIAATEARRSKSRDAHFFSDTMRLRSLARLDLTVELREAIATGGIQSRYIGRYDLADGRLVALLAYAKWTHPLRGDIAPREFLGLAESTGAAIPLSRAMLQALRTDFARYAPHVAADVRLSYGPLRHHLLHEDFVDDIDEFLEESGVPAQRLEIRIAERTFIVLHPSVCTELERRGIQLVVDELGRGMGSLDRLARAPLWGLQLDRPWVEGVRDDAVALKVCRAGISAAAALGLVPMVSGVDSDEQRLTLLHLGCAYGSGDLYEAPVSDAARAAAVKCA